MSFSNQSHLVFLTKVQCVQDQIPGRTVTVLRGLDVIKNDVESASPSLVTF